MKLQTLRALRGPNVWLDRPALEATLEVQSELRSPDASSFTAWLERQALMPVSAVASIAVGTFEALSAACTCTAACTGVHVAKNHAAVSSAEASANALACFERLRVLSAIALALQPGMGEYLDQVNIVRLPNPTDPSTGQAVVARPGQLASTSLWRVVVPYTEEDVARGALDAALLALEALAAVELSAAADGLSPQSIASVEQALDDAKRSLAHLDADIRLGPSTGAIVRAAEARGIAVKRLTHGSLVQFGQGIHQRRIWAAETDQTSALAEQVAQDKELTKSLLGAAGIPVPQGASVSTADEAWQLAQRLGLPVVLKPRDGNQGRGVSVNLLTEEAVRAAFAIAISEEKDALLEQHIEGEDFRLLVVGDRLIAAARREPPCVVGDGVRNIAELVEIENRDPRRGDDHSNVLSKIRLDEIALEVLSRHGMDADSVPAAGLRVVLRQNANLSTGGKATDVTDDVHPEVAALAVAAARVVGLDIAGIDLVATAVDRPLAQTRGAIVEVNAAPGLRMHLEPSAGKGRPVGDAIVDMMFPEGQQARIPVIAITGTNGKTTTTRAIAHLLKQQRLRVGMTCTDGIYVEGRRIEKGDCAGPKSARAVLAHPRVEAAVLETARGGILREGLGFDWCDVAVVTNIGEGDHLGLNAIDTKEELARVKSLIVRRVSPQGAAVLNADDPLVVAMAELCKGTVVFFSSNPESPVLVQHRQAGGQTVTVRNGILVIEQGQHQRRLGRIADMPLTHKGRVGFQVDNLLAAAAAAAWVGLSAPQLQVGLASFSSDLGIAPGRFNVLEHKGSTVIVDYGHNVDALYALGQAISRFEHTRRKVVYTAAGDRRDEDIQRQGVILADFFDEIFIYEDQCTRGRAAGVVMRLMREGFAQAKRCPLVRQLPSEMGAIGAAVHSLVPGDLLLCQIDQVETALEYLTGLLTSEPERSTARASTKSSPSIGLHAPGTDPNGARRAPRS